MSTSQVLQALKKADLVGSAGRNLIKSSFSPSVAVHVKYPSGEKVDLGNEIALDKTQSEPEVTFEATDSSTKPTFLAMLDPDAPSNSDYKWSPYCHWLTPSSESGKPQGTALMKFFPCGPPEKTGLHRYVYMALTGKPEGGQFKLPEGLERDNDDHRPKFAWEKFLELNGLEVVGVNFHVTKNPKQLAKA
ncbi:carboxypeptidase Y inhibitor [Microbotryomycetes sp. JL221]|nr:carboxypeptidase Y inhibitor [Microbotryomycetes sp. JL221]